MNRMSQRRSATGIVRAAAVATMVSVALVVSGCANDDEVTTSSASSSSVEDSSEVSETGETTTVLTYSEGGTEMTLTYYSIGDEVTRQTTTNVISYDSLGLTDEAQARAQIEPLAESFQGISGLEHSIEYGETSATETMTVDYAIANPAEIAQLTGSTFSGNVGDNSKISLEASLKALEAQGFTVVK